MANFKYDANAARKLIQDLDSYIKQLYVITKKLMALSSQRTFWNDTQKKKFSDGSNMLKNDVVKAMEAEVAYSDFYKEITKEYEG